MDNTGFFNFTIKGYAVAHKVCVAPNKRFLEN